MSVEISKYLCDLTFKPIEEIFEQLKIMNQVLDIFDELSLDENGIQIHNKSIGIRTHIPINQDYSTTAAMIGFAIYGIFWTSALPDYLEMVNKEWKQRSKESKKVQAST